MARQSIIEATKPPDANAILAFLRRKGHPMAQAGDGRERATSGNPGLSPGERTAVTKIMHERIKADSAVAEQRASEAEFESDDNGIPTTSLEAQLGRVMTCEQIQTRLRKLNDKFIFERCINYPELMGIYWPDARANVQNGVRRVHVCSMEFGFSPEWSIPNLKAKGAKKLTRGWRDLYLKLVARGYFSLADAERVFETKKSDRQSAKYMKAVQVTMQRLRERGFDVAKSVGV